MSRLLAAAVETPPELQASATSALLPTRDCVLPPALPPGAVPPRLRAALGTEDINTTPQFSTETQSSTETPGAALSAPPASRLSNPPLPLQRLLEDLGPEATTSRNMSSLARTLVHFGRPSEAAVASALLFLATAGPPAEAVAVDSHIMFQLFAVFCSDLENSAMDSTVQHAVATASPSPSEWRVDVLVQAVTTVAAQYQSPLDWRLVIRSLDADGLEKQLTQSAFVDIAKAHVTGTGGSLIPGDVILDDWRHPTSQVCMISHALGSQEYINWDMLDPFEVATPEDRTSPLSRIAVVEKLIELDARDLLQYALRQDPNLLLLSLTCSKPRRNMALQHKLTVSLLTPLITSYPKCEKTIRQLWGVTPTLVESGLISMWKKEPGRIQLAYRIATDLGILNDLLRGANSIAFSFELALLAYKDGAVNFEKWLADLLLARGMSIVSSITSQLAAKLRMKDGQDANLMSLDAVRIIFRRFVAILRGNGNNSQTQDITEAFQEVVQAYVRMDTRLTALSPSNDTGDPTILVGTDSREVIPTNDRSPAGVSSSHQRESRDGTSEAASTAATLLLHAPAGPNGGPGGFPAVIEKEASSYFENLYMTNLPTAHAVEHLRTYKLSNSLHDRRVFWCALHTLFDEYRFFKKYPDRELEITGRLFGSIVHESLLEGELQGLALKCVIDALGTAEPGPAPVGRLATFGLYALEIYIPRLKEWPSYCRQILKLPRLSEISPTIAAAAKQALEMNHGSTPSEAEIAIGLGRLDGDPTKDRIHSFDGAHPPVTSVQNPSIDADRIRPLVSPPSLSPQNTPVKDSFPPSTAIKPSPSITNNMDGSLAMSSLNLIALLGITAEEASKIVAPDDAIQDKIKFIFNNLSEATMDDKVKEMLDLLDPEYIPFFAAYVVVKRASSESNFHRLYLAMLERMDPKAPTLFKAVFETMYKRVQVLLASDAIVTSTSERMVLKSLGSWIGALTLGRNKPVLRKDLDLKELLMDAYSRGRLTAVFPFVSKVLEASRGSRVFKTTNPWIRGILSLMKEIYSVLDLKLGMRFELQLLCKSLNVDINDVSPSQLLKDRQAPDKNNNKDFNTKKPASASPLRSLPSPATSPSPELRRAYGQVGTTGRPGIPVFSLADAQSSTTSLPTIPVSLGPASSTGRVDLGNNLMNTNHTMPGESVNDLSGMLSSASLNSTSRNTNQLQRSPLHNGGGVSSGSVQVSGVAARQPGSMSATDSTVIPNLANYIAVSPSLLVFQQNPSLKRLLPLAIDRAIREIIQPVVERSCAIAFLTTKELTLKDFANEPDLGKVRRAALQMVQQLAGSLALVTSKEPLRVSMGNQLRSMLNPVVAEQNLIEQTSQVICAANLEVGCAIIERHAKEKAARDLNEKIAPAIAARRPQHSSYSLRNPLGPEVLRVYDEFGRLPRMNAAPAQHASSQQAPRPQPVRAMQPVASSHPSVPSSQRSEGAGNGAIPDHQANGSLPEPKYTETSSGSVYPGTRTVGPLSSTATNTQGAIAGRRTVPPSVPAKEKRGSFVPSTRSLPVMASASELSTALTAAAGPGSNGSGPNLNGGQSMGLHGTSLSGEPESMSIQQVLERFNGIYPQLTTRISEAVTAAGTKAVTLGDLPPDHEINQLWVQIPSAVKRSETADEAGMAVAQKVFKHLYEGDSSLYHEIHVLILEGLRESCRRLSKELVSWLAYSEERKKLHRECIVALLKPGSLLNITNYDELLAKTIDNGRNKNALEFACFLVRRAVIDEPLATAAELYLTLEAMAKVGRRDDPGPPTLVEAPDGLVQLVEASRNVTHQASASNSVTSSANDFHSTSTRQQPHQSQQHKDVAAMDPVGTREAIAMCLSDWQRIIESDASGRPVSEAVILTFLGHVRANFMSTDEALERFSRITIELVRSVTAHALRSPASGVPGDLMSAPYTAVDAVVPFIAALCRSDPGNSSDNISRSVFILVEFLRAVVKDIIKVQVGADLRPHFRILSGLMADLAIHTPGERPGTGSEIPIESEKNLSTADLGLPTIPNRSEALQFLDERNDGLMRVVRNAGFITPRESGYGMANFQVLAAFVGALSACSPLVVPGFSFSWLQLSSNKEIMPRLLMAPSIHGGNLYLHLLNSMLCFLSRYLRDPQDALSEGIRTLYKGVLRVFLVLLHDFPEFLCDYHMAIVDVIPHCCVQLRNIVLSSFPKSMRLPDPFLPELKVDQLPAMASKPRILTDFKKYLNNGELLATVETYLRDPALRRGTRPPLLKPYFVIADETSERTRYSIPTIGAFVLDVGQIAIARLSSGTTAAMDGPATEWIQSVIQELDPEGQYHLFNAIVNQIRYPNCHTLYFSRLILYLFLGSNEDAVKEQITRVLVERLITSRPHPWGLLVTFVELVKNSIYNFWRQDFVRCAPEIEELFESVAKVCIGPAIQSQHSQSVPSSAFDTLSMPKVN